MRIDYKKLKQVKAELRLKGSLDVRLALPVEVEGSIPNATHALGSSLFSFFHAIDLNPSPRSLTALLAHSIAESINISLWHELGHAVDAERVMSEGTGKLRDRVRAYEEYVRDEKRLPYFARPSEQIARSFESRAPRVKLVLDV